MKPYRSMLFVPGHKPDWVPKGIATGADALILDLEDSVPPQLKGEARAATAGSLDVHGGGRCALWVRPNAHITGLMGADLEEVIRPGIAGLFLPKVFTAEEIVRIDAVVSHLEERVGMEHGTVEFIVSFETAASMGACEEIAAASPRIASLLGATGPDADAGRELGIEFTPEGLETLYLRSRIVLAQRAVGMQHPVVGVWQDLRNLEGLRTFCLDNRRLGYRGLVAIHPSHVAVANEVFTPSDEVVERSRRLIAAYQEAEAAGHSAVEFEGVMIDLAHLKTAQGVIELADAIAGNN